MICTFLSLWDTLLSKMIYMAVDMVDTPSDVTDPDTLIIPVEHHPTASDEATCTTALQSTHRTDQHTPGA